MGERIAKLSFLGPVHFGEGRLSGSGYTFDAATLFSALYLEALRLGCVKELLAAVNKSISALKASGQINSFAAAAIESVEQ